MAKNFLIAMLFCTLHLTFAPIFANNELAPYENPTPKVDFCNAPAPDNFRVTSFATDLVTLGWIPAWAGADQTLEVFIEDSGNWITLFTYYNMPGDSYTIDDLEPGYYSAKIATNCPNGETSLIESKVLFRFKIIDLTTAGRMPKDPVAVEDCTNIYYQNHEWVGFSVTEIQTGVSNIFEFVFTEDKGDVAIKRVLYNHPIVAVNKDGLFPTDINPIIGTSVPFRIDYLNDDKSSSIINIGYVTCKANSSTPTTIELCKHTNNPPINWKSEYDFTAMTAEGVLTDYPNDPGESGDKTSGNTIIYEKFRAQSPFSENLNVFFAPRMHAECSKARMILFNTNGQKILTYDFELVNSLVSFPLDSISPGIYILQIETEFELQILKVIKSD